MAMEDIELVASIWEFIRGDIVKTALDKFLT
jgi:hypothetical protein